MALQLSRRQGYRGNDLLGDFMKGKIIGVTGGGTLYGILVQGDEGLFNIPVEHRYFWNIIEDKGDIVGKEIEYKDNTIFFLEDMDG